MIPVSVSGKPMAAKKAKETDEASRSTTNDVPSSDGDGVPDGGGIGGRADNCGDDDDDDDAVEVASSAANESEPPSGDDLAEHRRAAADLAFALAASVDPTTEERANLAEVIALARRSWPT